MKVELHIEGKAIPPVVALLMRGRERVEKGWCQRAFGNGAKVCAMEALHAGEGEGLHPEIGTALRGLLFALPRHHRSVIAYNDDPTTTKADILALYDRAISNAIGESR